MQTNQATMSKAQPQDRKLEIELLFLDLNTCTRCVGTDANLEVALQTVQPMLATTGMAIDVHKILIDSAAKAQQHGLVTSPTIRINGQDIALTSKESECASCTDLCGCEEGVVCRVWDYQGVEYTEAPVGLIVEAILQGIFGVSRATQSAAMTSTDIPANLQRFFAAHNEPAVTDGAAACCGDKEQQSCCEPSAKATCCGAQAVPGSCGCK